MEALAIYSCSELNCNIHKTHKGLGLMFKLNDWEVGTHSTYLVSIL